MKYRINFFLDKEKGKDTARVRLRINYNKNIVSFTVGYRVEIEKWNEIQQRCNRNTTHDKVNASIINARINKYELIAHEIFSQHGVNIDPEKLKEIFNNKIGKNSTRRKNKSLKDGESSVNILFEEFIKERSILNSWTDSTIGKLNTIKNHLISFYPGLKLEDLNEELLIDYQYYLQNEANLKNSTIIKHFSFLRWFFNYLISKEYVNNEPYLVFKPHLKTAQNKIIFLTKEELKQVQLAKLPAEKKYLERVRDIFIFLCYTGLRFSDAMSLKKSDVKDGFLEVTTQKTTDNLIIELNKTSRKIIKKYKKYDPTSDRVLPKISNQRMNQYLKELAEIAELNEMVRLTHFKAGKRIDEVIPKRELITTHVGRRTFICSALSMNIPPHVVMKWTGHSDYKAMKPYIDIADNLKAEAMKNFDEF